MEIHVLSSETINRIAAGEVIERPLNVVKELVENAIDAGADAISVEIKGGGSELIRVTDNGCGIEPSQITKAFLRHATSKIQDENDLSRLESLGFRGEALSSIAAVSEVEMITKTRGSLTGVRATNQFLSGYDPDRKVPIQTQEIGAPDGTSVIVRNLFYNVPVRKKFLRQPQTEAGYVTDLMEQLSLSHPDISFHYRVNGREKLHTTGNGNLKELIYRIYGRDVMNHILPVCHTENDITIEGFIGRPEISRSTRAYEVFFVNGRMLKSNLLSKALEAGYRTDLMQHRFPFAVLHLTLSPSHVDVNVHPNKMEVRFDDRMELYDFIDSAVHEVLHRTELIPQENLDTPKAQRTKERDDIREREQIAREEGHREPFEQKEKGDEAPERPEKPQQRASSDISRFETQGFVFEDRRTPAPQEKEEPEEKKSSGRYEQASLFSDGSASYVEEGRPILSRENKEKLRIIGQVFDTYWLVEYEDKLLLIDQHAAHEKVNYERLMKHFSSKEGRAPSQMLLPPIVLTMTGREEGAFLQYQEYFTKMGFEIEPLGEGAYAVRAVPTELYGAEPDAMLRDTLDEILGEKLRGTPQLILSRIATMSCKAAVKGNTRMSQAEAQALIEELMTLDNPYHCPHGRPTMITISKTEMEKKFKRIV